MKEKKIGIYGGSFDPFHHGHFNLAMEIMEAKGLDEVWFCPAACNPHKKDQQPTAAHHRLNMVRLAIEEEPRFKVIDTEIKRQGLSYTIDTLKELEEANSRQLKKCRFFLILGEDSIFSFHKWHKVEEIVDLVPLYIGKRSDSKNNNESIQGSPKVVQAIKNGLVSTRIMDISSQEIRKRLLEKKNCDHLVSRKVMDYIITNHLYYPFFTPNVFHKLDRLE